MNYNINFANLKYLFKIAYFFNKKTFIFSCVEALHATSLRKKQPSLMKKKHFIFTFYFLLIISSVFAQNDTLSGSQRVDYLNKLAKENITSDTILFGKYATEALELSKELEYATGFEQATVNIVTFNNNNQMFAHSFDILDNLKKYAEKKKDSALIGKTIYLIANTYYVKADFAKSLQYNLIALPIVKKYAKTDIASDILLNIGRIYYYAKNPENSLKYYNEALELTEELHDTVRIAKLYSWIGYAYSQKKEHELSLEYHKKALEFANHTELKSAIAIYTSSIGDSYIELNQYEQALEYILRANKLFSNINHNEGYSWTIMSSGTCYFEMGLYEEAIKNPMLAFEIAQNNRYMLISERSCKNLYQIYKAQNMDTKTLYYLELYNSCSDSLINKGKLSEISEIQIKYEVERQEMQKKILETEINLRKQELKVKKYQNRILFFLISIIVIISVLIFYFLKLKNNSLRQKNEIYEKERLLKEKQIQIDKTQKELIEAELKNIKLEKQRLSDELEFKSKELVNFALHITQKNEFFMELKKEINKLKKKYKTKEIIKIYIRINEIMQIDTDREKFQIHVEEVHQSFFHNLKLKYPELTKGDKRLLALLMMNLSSKEISSIINISPSSVNTKRYRLRKKLNIDSDENLIEFVKSI